MAKYKFVKERIQFKKDDLTVDDEFRSIVDTETNQVWLEAVKICEKLDHVDAQQAISHVSEGNLRKYEYFATNQTSLLGGDHAGDTIKPELLFINKAAFWELSQHLHKPAFKIFWWKMSLRQLDNAEKEDKIIELEDQLELTNNRLEFVSKKNKSLMSKYNVLKNLCIEIMADNISSDRLARITNILSRTLFRVSDNMELINPNKADLNALIWHRPEIKYSCKRLSRATFNSQYHYIQRDRDSPIENIVPGGRGPTVTMSRGKNVVIGSDLPTANARNMWHIVKQERPDIVFGLQFENRAMVKFAILDEERLRMKYREVKQLVDDNENLIDWLPLEKYLMLRSMSLYRNLNLNSEDDCVSRCLVHDIWVIYDILRDRSQNIDLIEKARSFDNSDRDGLLAEAVDRLNLSDSELSTNEYSE